MRTLMNNARKSFFRHCEGGWLYQVCSDIIMKFANRRAMNFNVDVFVLSHSKRENSNERKVQFRSLIYDRKRIFIRTAFSFQKAQR